MMELRARRPTGPNPSSSEEGDLKFPSLAKKGLDHGVFLIQSSISIA